jgi:hypothetical protein
MHRMGLDARRLGEQGSDDDTGAVAQRVHSQQRVWRTGPHLGQAVEFFVGQEHSMGI